MAGTGSAVFLDAFDWTVRHSISNTSLLPGLDPKIHWLVLQASLVGNEGFLRDEAGTLAQLIGGGYELVAQSAKGFYKVDDVTVVLWDALCSFEGRPKYRYAPFLAYKMSYKGDALVVRVRSLGGKSYGGVDFPARDAPFFALPPYSDSPDPLPDEIKSVQLESQAVCHMVFVSRDDAFLGFFLNIDFGSGRGHCEDVVFSYTKQGERISFGCEISENRKQAFRDGILDMTVIKPALSSPT